MCPDIKKEVIQLFRDYLRFARQRTHDRYMRADLIWGANYALNQTPQRGGGKDGQRTVQEARFVAEAGHRNHRQLGEEGPHTAHTTAAAAD
jgi:hypothetical protein